jgi:HD-like signal output (HDOD) protein
MNPRELIQSDVKLFSLPTIVSEINLLASTGSVREIGHLVSQDPALTARLLRIANSGYYGLPHKIDNVQQAVAMVGMHQLIELVMATVAVARFAAIRQDLVDMEAFWQRSILMAVAIGSVAEKVHNKDRGWLFVAGLLHDIGSLILYTKLPGQSQAILDQAGGIRSRVPELEKATLGFTAADVSAALATEWHMPEIVSRCLEKQLAPLNSPDHDVETRLMRLARLITDSLFDGTSTDECLAGIAAEAPNDLPLVPEDLKILIDELPDLATKLYGGMLG